MGRVLAIDYGRKRVGIAVTDELQMIANGLTTIHPEKLIDFLKEYISQENVDCIVVGEPRDMKYRLSEAEEYIRPFLKKLTKEFPGMKVERVDERFTSKMASGAMLEAGLKKKDRQNKALVDTISATLILQSYLEMVK